MKRKYVAAFYSGLQLCLTSWDIYFYTILSPHVEKCCLVPRCFGQTSPGVKYMSVGGTLVILVPGRC